MTELEGQHQWQPVRRGGDVLLFARFVSVALRCGRVERRAASKALGRVVRHADGLFKRLMRQELSSTLN